MKREREREKVLKRVIKYSDKEKDITGYRFEER